MSDARKIIDAIKYTYDDDMCMSVETTIGETFGADAILAALAEAGLEIRTRGSIEALEAEVAAATKHAQLLNKMLGEAEARAERLHINIKRSLPYIGPGYEHAALRDILEKALEDDKQ